MTKNKLENYALSEVKIVLKDGPRVYSTEPISSPEAAVELLASKIMADLDREYVMVVNLNNGLQPISYNVVSIGSINQAIVSVPNVFKSSILSNAASIMIIHNHPSGNLNASKQDIDLTKKLRKAGELMDIPLVDSIIVGGGHYVSLREEGYFRDFSENSALGMAEKSVDYKAEQRNKLKEMTDKLEDGVKAVFASDEYQKYLSCMSKFRHYSINNLILIHMQRPDATHIASYTDWQRSFNRQVNKGEKGIRIIAPSPYKRKIVEDVKDEQGQPVLETDGSAKKVVREVPVEAYKIVTCFDISQTSGDPLPTIGVDELKGSVEAFKDIDRAIRDISMVPISTEDIKNGAKGYYSRSENKIVIKSGMDDAQTLKTEIHELAHSLLHSNIGSEKDVDRNTKEVQADSIAYVVSEHYGFDVSSYSFPYIAGWSSDKTVPELKASLDIIRKTSANIINQIDEKLLVYKAEETDKFLENIKNEALCMTAI